MAEEKKERLQPIKPGFVFSKRKKRVEQLIQKLKRIEELRKESGNA